MANGNGFLPPKVVEGLIGALLAIMSFLGLAVWNDIRDVRESNEEFRATVLREYVQKDDYNIDMQLLYDQLKEINRKLDKLADK